MSAFYVPIRRLAYTLLGRIPQARPLITVYCYHSIAGDGWDFSVPLTEFKKQITYLTQNYDFISLSDLGDYLAGKKVITRPSVVITFDDGYADITSAGDFLKSLHIRPAVFVFSDPEHANRRELGNQKPLLNRKQILKLAGEGWEIGCHTATHPDMADLNPVRIQAEIIDSKTRLEADLGIKINSLAFPKGVYDSKILGAARRAKYLLAFTMDDTRISPQTDSLRIPRVGVDGTHTFNEFRVLGFPTSIYIRKTFKYL
jgi:peptidoglycan/xylan/chitin deacetylase (PgdA/CDA1 family)